ncbi:hypothetical protein TRFO_18878 [Tritrichomonas foetus]|uniref:AIR9-like A9 domain-containing protein n=1 Tax=Tritrichomonas foetus TaxID=1144522 RepID=A0A1J4KJY1_9EUKA|nr:hypothetical protein TRFO_18878 [Tritrichomonas foetus]|eukprot:OHT11617.1 hypothetical protein TRFO_18878 [Tritrichomonas foetus]
MSFRSTSRQSYAPKTPRSPISPRLKPPETKVPQSKIDRVHSTFLSISSSKLTSLPASAQAPNLLSIDLENNQLKSASLAKLPKGLTTLNLVNNPLLDMKLPLLKHLRSISLDSCGLTSFQGFPMFPQLRFLSVSNNKLRSFKYLPPLMKLEYFNIANNPVDFTLKLSIAAIGSISLTTFNDKEITANQLIDAFQLSPLVGYSLRMGRDIEPCETPEEEVRKSQDYLTNRLAQHIASKDLPPIVMNLNVCNYEGESSLICPIESPSIKWYRSRSPDRGSEWVLLQTPPDMKQNNVLPLTMLLRMHLVKCEFVLDNKTFCVFTDYPIGHDPEDLCLPFPLDPVIAGLPLEGSLISLIPLPMPARAAWLRQTTTIAEDVTSIILTNNEIGSVITCLLQPYCPNYPEVAFATVFVETDKVDAILPTVSGLKFPDNLVEGVKINFTRKIFPDREGESQILIERARGITEEWLLLAELSPDDLSYIPSCEDAGCYLRVSYAPVTAEGVVGETVYFYSSTRVLPTLPVFTNGVIGGLPKTNFTVCAVADYKGGRRGHCSYNWFYSPVPITSANIKQLDLVAKDTQMFTIPPEFKDGYLACEMVPVREDEVIGEAIYAALTEPIIEDDPPEEFPYFIPKEVTNGTEFKFDEQVTFYISSTKGFCGFTEVKRGTTLTIRDKWIGQILRFVTNSCDVVVGEIKLAPPVIQHVGIRYSKCEYGETATLEIVAKSLRPDRFEVMWIRCCGGIEKAVAFNTPEYTFQAHDIGFQIKARVTPFDDNLIYLPYCESKITPTVKEGQLSAPIISGKLVEGENVQVVYNKEMNKIKWLRSDAKEQWVDTGITGQYYTIAIPDIGRYLRAQIQVGESTLIATTTDVCAAAPPVGYAMFSSTTAHEGDLLQPHISFHGGVEGKSVFKWEKLIQEIDGKSKWETISEKVSYKVLPADIGSTLRFTYIPVRNDKVQGTPVVVEFHRVQGLLPTVKNVMVKQNERGFIECTGDYSGGVEGMSYFLWHATDNEGKVHNIGKTNDREIFPPVQLVGLKVEATYCPIRDDGEEGEQIRSSNYVVCQPLPTVESIDILVKDGVVRVGQIMRCKAVCSEGAKPKFQWYRGDGQANWLMIPDQTKADYTLTEDDSGYYVLCLASPINKAGWEGKGISAVTPTPVEPGDITLSIVPQKTRGTNKDMYWTGATLTTNFPEEEVSWEREVKSENGGIEWIVLGDAKSYQITVNDIGCRLRAAVGDYESKPTPAIVISPEVGSFVNAQVRSRHLTFKAKASTGSASWEFTCDQNGMVMKSKRQTAHDKRSPWSSIRVDGVDGTLDQLILWMDAATKFILIPQLKGDSRFKAIVIKNARDFIVYTIQQFIVKNTQQQQ